VVVPGNGVMVVCGSFNDGVEVLFCGQEEPMAEVAGGMLVAWMEDVSERHVVVEKNNGRCVRLECNVAMTSPPRARSFACSSPTPPQHGETDSL